MHNYNIQYLLFFPRNSAYA